MVGKYLAYLNLNKIISAYIINIALEMPEKIQCLKQLAQRGTWPSYYMYAIECVEAYVFEQGYCI